MTAPKTPKPSGYRLDEPSAPRTTTRLIDVDAIEETSAMRSFLSTLRLTP